MYNDCLGASVRKGRVLTAHWTMQPLQVPAVHKTGELAELGATNLIARVFVDVFLVFSSQQNWEHI